MAELATQHIQLLEKLMTDLGYDMTGHTAGQNDDAFKKAFAEAEKDLLKLAGSDAKHIRDATEKLDSEITELQQEINKNVLGKLTIQGLDSSNQDVTQALPQEILDRLNPINPNFVHIIEFAEGYGQYRAALLAADAALYPDTTQAAPAQGQQAAPAQRTEPFSNIPVNQAETNAANALGAEKITALQQILISQGLELTANGQWDSATKTAYINSLLIATNNKTVLTDITQSSALLQTQQQNLATAYQGAQSQLQVIDNNIATYKEQYDWGWTDGTWLESHDITNEELDQKITQLEQEKLQITQQANQMAAVAQNWQQSLDLMNGEFKPLLSTAHSSAELQNVITPPSSGAPVDPANNQQQQASGAAAIIETFLSNDALKKTVEDAAKMLGDSDFKLSQPINAGDGIIDAGSDAGLQQVLSFLVSDVATGLKQYQSQTNEPTTYTPALGHALAEALQNPKHPNATTLSQINKTLNDAFAKEGITDLKDPKDPSKSIQAIDYLVIQLDDLYKKKSLKREAIKELDLINAQMDPVQMGILNFAIKFIPPEMIAAFDGIVRQFTGGHGILDLMPQLKSVESINQALGGMDDLDPTQRLAESFKRSFKNAENAADRDALKDSLVDATALIENLPFGSGERRRNYPAAVDSALSAAMATMGDIKPSDPNFEAKLNEASLVYADSFKKNMHELSQKHGGADRQANPGITTNEQVLTAELSQAGFDIDGKGGAVSADEINRIVAAYNNANFGASPHSQNPLIFTDNNGNTFTAGISQPSNIFTIQPLPITDISQAITNGASQEALSETYAGYALLNGTYRHSFHGYLRTHDVSYDNVIVTAASDPSVAKPFSAIEHSAQGRAQVETMRQDLEDAFMDTEGRARLERDLAGAIVNHRTRELRNGRSTDPLNTKVAGPNVDTTTADLIELREMAQDDDKARKMLDAQPKTYTSLKGEIYIFSKIANENQSGLYQKAFEVNATEEVARYSNLTADKVAFYQSDPALMKAHFPNLTVVANQYPQHTNAFSLAREMTSENGLRFKPAPLVNNIPAWLKSHSQDPQNYDSLKAQTANKPQILFDQNDKSIIRLVAKGNENRAFIGHDITEELNRYRTLNNEQRQSIFTNPGQSTALFPRMSELAEQYDTFSPEVLATSLLARPDIQDHLGITANNNAPERENNAQLQQGM